MKTTTGDRIAFACVLAALLLTAGGWVFALALERTAQRLMQTAYSKPTAQFGAALAAGDADDTQDMHLARGR
jgi:hypothetical protein